MDDKDRVVSATASLTTIAVHGVDQEMFEVYADSTKSQTLGFVVDEDRVRYLVHGHKLNESHGRLLACLKSAVAIIAGDYPAQQHAERGINRMAEAIDAAGKVFWE